MKTRTRTNTKVNPSPQSKVTTTLERHSISQEIATSQSKTFSSANSNSNPYSHNLRHISPFRPAPRQIIIAGERDSKAIFEQQETKNFSKAVVQPRTNSFISTINSISSTDNFKIQRGLWNKIKKTASKAFDWVKEKIVKPIKRAAKRLLNGIKKQAKRLISSLKNAARRLLGKAKRAILNFIRKIKRAVKKLILKAKRLVTKVIRKAQRYAMKIGKKVASVAKKLLKYARNLAKKYAQKMMKLTHYFLKIGNPQKAQKLIQKLNKFAGKIVDWATKKIMGLVRHATAIVTKVMQKATRQISRLINWAAGGVQRLVKKVTSVTQRLINRAIKGVENFIRKAGNVTHLFNKAKSKLNRILGPARGKANWLIDSMMKAANNMLRGFLMPLAKRAGSWMRRLLRPAMKLVSKLLNKATSGITRGIKAATNRLTKSMQWLIGKIKKLLELYVEKIIKPSLQLGATIVKRVIDGVIKAIEKIILEPLKAFFEFMNLISQILAKAAGVIDKILAHPVRFIKNLFSGVKQGLSGFISRLGIHMQKGLQTFLFGSMGETGIEMPKSFDFSGLISVVAQVSGISYDRIRDRAAGKLGEDKVAFLEEGAAAAQEGNLGEFAEQKAQGYADNQMAAVKEKAGPLGKIADIFKILREGPSGIIQYFKELDFNSLITGIIGEIKEYLIQEIVQKAVIQVISYLTPGAGWLKAAIDALRVMYSLFIERAQQIKEFLDGFTDSIVNIAKRAIAPAVKKLEGALGKTLPLLIGVLADYLGIGGIPQKIQGFLMKGRKWVDANVMPIIDKILDKIAAIFAKLPSANIADYLPKGMGMGAVYPKIRKYLKPYTRKTFKTFNDAQKVVNTAQTVFKRFGIKSLNLEQADKTGHTFNVIAAKPLPGRKISPVVGRVQTFNNIQPRASLGVKRGISVKARSQNTSVMSRVNNPPLKTHHPIKQHSIASLQRKPSPKQITSRVQNIAIKPKPTISNLLQQKPPLVSKISRKQIQQQSRQSKTNQHQQATVQKLRLQNNQSISNQIISSNYLSSILQKQSSNNVGQINLNDPAKKHGRWGYYTKYIPAFAQGLYSGFIGSFKDIYDLVAGILKTIFKGEVISKARQLWNIAKSLTWEDIKNAIGESVSQWIDEITSDNPKIAGKAHGKVIGYIAAEALLAFITGGASLVFKSLGKLFVKFKTILEKVFDSIKNAFARNKIHIPDPGLAKSPKGNLGKVGDLSKLSQIKKPVKIGKLIHTLKLKRFGNKIRLIICSECGPILEKIDQVLPNISPKGPTKSLHNRLAKLRERSIALETSINTGQVSFKKIPAEVNQIAAHLKDLSKKYPEFNFSPSFRAIPDYTSLANRLGFTRTNYTSHGQPVYRKGNRYISPDTDSHIGGVWKMADSVRNLGSKKTRMGTYNENLTRIGD